MTTADGEDMAPFAIYVVTLSVLATTGVLPYLTIPILAFTVFVIAWTGFNDGRSGICGCLSS